MTKLCELAGKYGTDKGPDGHNYTPFYAALLSPRHVGRLLEIGVYKGASLRMWAEYLPDAEVFGVDIEPSCLFDEGRIRCFRGDQLDCKSLEAAARAMGTNLDVIIDDGEHELEHQTLVALALIPFLSPNGLYVVEDVRPKNMERLKAAIPYESFLVKFPLSRHPAGNDDSCLLVIQEEGLRGRR